MWKEFEYKHLFEKPPRKPCFLAGTLVKSENGHKQIEQIEVVDQVFAYNFETKKAVLKPVTELFQNRCDKYIEIYTSQGKIRATGAHRFWIPTQNKWVKARELKVNMEFLNFNEKYTQILDLKIIDQAEKTYNFEVADLHNYFVGNDEVLSHNKSIADSIFASTEIVEVYFYKILDPKMEAMYVGQTVQKVETRYAQHKLDPKKASWSGKMRGVFELELFDGKPGPYKMTRYEAAVVELYEINKHGGISKGNNGLYNKSKPIVKKKFDYFKIHRNFNPCLFYA